MYMGPQLFHTTDPYPNFYPYIYIWARINSVSPLRTDPLVDVQIGPGISGNSAIRCSIRCNQCVGSMHSLQLLTSYDQVWVSHVFHWCSTSRYERASQWERAVRILSLMQWSQAFEYLAVMKVGPWEPQKHVEYSGIYYRVLIIGYYIAMIWIRIVKL